MLRALGRGTVSALSLLHGQELAALVCPVPSLVLLTSSFCWGCLPGACLKPPLRCLLSPAMAEELSDLLREFDEVMEDFERGPACQYEQHLEELKRKAGHSVYDSGIDELESESGE